MNTSRIPEDLNKYLIEELPHILEKQNIPGASVVIVKENEILHMQSYGYKDFDKKVPVNTKTLFAIGSTSKAITAAVLGTLVDEGKLGWDDLVIDYVPEFRTVDPVANMQMTIRDIQCHRSGIPRHDLVWLVSEFSRQELLEKIQYLEPFAPFRSTFHYNNFMWMLAGIVSERITGKSWEENVVERIFRPLGIEEANFSVSAMQRSTDFSFPYEVKDGKVNKVPFRKIDAIGPAGSINANIEDYARWIMLNVNNGNYLANQVISSESLAEIQSPQMALPVTDELAQGFRMIKEFSDLVYTLGWVSVHFRGRRHIMHAGGIDGFSSFITVMPDEKIGLGILTNKGGITSHYGVILEAVDRYFGDTPGTWVEMIAGFEEMALGAEEQAEKALLEAQVKNTKPSHPLESFAGVYSHPAYGLMKIEVENNSLVGTYNQNTIQFSHYHYNIFQIILDNGGRELKYLVNFVTNSKGKIVKALIPFETKVTEIEFTRNQD